MKATSVCTRCPTGLEQISCCWEVESGVQYRFFMTKTAISVVVSLYTYRRFALSLDRKSSLKVPRDVDDHNPLVATHQKKKLKQLGTLIVEGRLPPVFDD